jgi:hypothetical protein
MVFDSVDMAFDSVDMVFDSVDMAFDSADLAFDSADMVFVAGRRRNSTSASEEIRPRRLKRFDLGV